MNKSQSLGLAAEDDSVVLGLEPLHCVLLGQAVRESNMSNLAAPVLDVHAGTAKDNIEVHSVDTNAGIVLDSKINMFLDAVTEVAVGGEVLLPQLVLLNLEATLQDLFSLKQNIKTQEKKTLK